MKPQLSHLNLQCSSIMTAPQRSHVQILVPVCVVVPMNRTPSIEQSTLLRLDGGWRIVAQTAEPVNPQREV